MPRPFPTEFRIRAVTLVRAGKPITTAAVELGVSAAAIHNWVRQDQIDRRERSGITTPESIELAKAKKRIRQLETEVEILKIAAKLLGEDRPGPKRFTRESTFSFRRVTGPKSAAGSLRSAVLATTNTNTVRYHQPRCAGNG